MKQQVQRRFRQLGDRARDDVVVGQHHDADLVLGDDQQRRGKTVDRAHVPDGVVLAELPRDEAQSVTEAILRGLRLEHLLQRLGRRICSLAGAAAAAEHHHKAGQILGRGVKIAGGNSGQLKPRGVGGEKAAAAVGNSHLPVRQPAADVVVAGRKRNGSCPAGSKTCRC